MLKTIWKETFEITSRVQKKEMPKGAEIKHVDRQGDLLCAWFECNPQREVEQRCFTVVGTGHKLNNLHEYVGTMISKSESFVWHLFELKDPK